MQGTHLSFNALRHAGVAHMLWNRYMCIIAVADNLQGGVVSFLQVHG
jgi:hypothetical protein